MLRKQAKRRRGLNLEYGDRRAVVGTLAMLQHGAQFGILDENAAAGLAEAKTLVDPYQIRRGEDVNTQTSRFQDRAQIGDGRSLAVGAGDVDHARQLAFGMTQPLQQPMYPLQVQIDGFRMQRRQPRDQVAKRRHWSGRGRVHACGAADTTSAVDAIGAWVAAGFGAVSIAGDFMSRRQSRARVGRRSWRCTTMSIMPWSLRYSAR